MHNIMVRKNSLRYRPRAVFLLLYIRRCERKNDYDDNVCTYTHAHTHTHTCIAHSRGEIRFKLTKPPAIPAPATKTIFVRVCLYVCLYFVARYSW